jgi:mannose-6-phosphate isomerase
MAARPDTNVIAAAVRLSPRMMPKPWGRTTLGDWGLGLCKSGGGQAIGEIHHIDDAAADPALLVKTLFTAERLSVQVHPDNHAARTSGAARGKDEAWVVLAADPGARIGLGLNRPVDAETLRAAALDGSIVELLHWHQCVPGDVFFTPAGTIHAIGGGVTLFEIQQNSDLTYRLFDYGRGRPLHLDAGLAVAHHGPWQRQPRQSPAGPGRELLVAGPSFVLERLKVAGAGTLRPPAGDTAWVAVVGGSGRLGENAFAPGEVWSLVAPLPVSGVAELLVAHVGDRAIADLWSPA